jgi:hypothetical protein
MQDIGYVAGESGYCYLMTRHASSQPGTHVTGQTMRNMPGVFMASRRWEGTPGGSFPIPSATREFRR